MMNKEDYYRNLPRKRVAAGILVFHKKKLLIVKPNYKDSWLIPGGVVEKNESPLRGAEREYREELGLIPNIQKLLCIDYSASSDQNKGDSLHFIFNSKDLHEEDLSKIKLQSDELSDYKLTNVEEALKLFEKKLSKTVKEAIDILQKNKMGVLCENGCSVLF